MSLIERSRTRGSSLDSSKPRRRQKGQRQKVGFGRVTFAKRAAGIGASLALTASNSRRMLSSARSASS